MRIIPEARINFHLSFKPNRCKQGETGAVLDGGIILYLIGRVKLKDEFTMRL